jgi:hypothetical protein
VTHLLSSAWAVGFFSGVYPWDHGNASLQAKLQASLQAIRGPTYAGIDAKVIVAVNPAACDLLRRSSMMLGLHTGAFGRDPSLGGPLSPVDIGHQL